jgi:hypothetical protein
MAAQAGSNHNDHGRTERPGGHHADLHRGLTRMTFAKGHGIRRRAGTSRTVRKLLGIRSLRYSSIMEPGAGSVG